MKLISQIVNNILGSTTVCGKPWGKGEKGPVLSEFRKALGKEALSEWFYGPDCPTQAELDEREKSRAAYQSIKAESLFEKLNNA